MNGKALSWQQVLCVILLIPLLMFAVFAFGVDMPHGMRLMGYVGLPICTLLLIWLICSHYRANHRADLQPDVLATLVNPAAIFEFGNAAHFVVMSRQIGGALRLDVLIQNNRDDETTFSLRFDPTVAALAVPPIECIVGPADLVHAMLSLPLHPALSKSNPIKAKLFISGNALGKGNRVRFARRLGVTKRVNPGMTAALLVVGHIHAGGGTIVPVQIAPFTPIAPNPTEQTPEWSYRVLWSPDAPATFEEMVAEMAQDLAPVER